MNLKAYATLFFRLFFLTLPLTFNDFYLPLIPDKEIKLDLILDFMVYILWQGSVIYFAHQAGWFKWSDLGISLEKPLRKVSQGILLFFIIEIIFLILFLSVEQLDKVIGTSIAESWHDPLPEWQLSKQMLYIFYLAVTAGFFEEIIYRGLAMREIAKAGLGGIWQVLISAAVFASIHWSIGWFTMTVAFIFGIIWGILYLRYRSLLPIMIAHFIFNFLAFAHWDLSILRALGLTGL